MLQYLKKRWNYLIAKLSGSFEETADPKVQLEQAITEAKDQHKRLKQQAANVIANQKQTELRLNRSIEELEQVNANARQAVTMADDAHQAGDSREGRALHQRRRAVRQPPPHPGAGDREPQEPPLPGLPRPPSRPRTPSIRTAISSRRS